MDERVSFKKGDSIIISNQLLCLITSPIKRSFLYPTNIFHTAISLPSYSSEWGWKKSFIIPFHITRWSKSLLGIVSVLFLFRCSVILLLHNPCQVPTCPDTTSGVDHSWALSSIAWGGGCLVLECDVGWMLFPNWFALRNQHIFKHLSRDRHCAELCSLWARAL